MKLTLDTKSDSKEDIRKAIMMLQAFIEDMPDSGESESSENVPDAQPGMFGMFEQNEEKKDDNSKIITY